MISVEAGAFGDVRRAARYCSMLKAAVSDGTLVLRRLGGNRAGEVGVQRFLSSQDVTVEELVAQASAQTARAAQGRGVVLAVQDTCEINFAPSKRRRGLGRGGHRTVVGYFAHPTLAVDAADGSLIGVAGLQLWTRAQEGAAGGGTEAQRRQAGRGRRSRSAGWLARVRAARFWGAPSGSLW